MVSGLSEGEALQRFTAARVAVLATIGSDNAPHQVPITFVVDGATVLSAVDGKPKSDRPLRRHSNIQADPRVSLLVQYWEEDWSRLFWVRADGLAIVTGQTAVVDRAVAALHHKYHQYRHVELRAPVIEVTVSRWSGWQAAGE